MIDKRIVRLQEIETELHDLANSFAGKETGVVAARLHGVGGGISDCLRMLEDGVNSADRLSLAEDWLAKQHGQFMDAETIARML